MQHLRFLLAATIVTAPLSALQEPDSTVIHQQPPTTGNEQAPPTPLDLELPAGAQSREQRSLATLDALRDSIADKEGELDVLQGKIESGQDSSRRLEHVAEVNALQQEIKRLRDDFDSVATGIDVRAFGLGMDAEFDLFSEVESLLKPIVAELREATEAPREMERLRGALDYAAKHEVLAKTAVKQLDGLIQLSEADNTSTELTDALKASRKNWKARIRELDNQRTVAEFQLEQHEARKRSVIDSMQSMSGDFFRTRGLNLLLAGLTFLGILFGLRMAYRTVSKKMRKHSRGEREFYARLLDVLYFGFSGFAALGGALLVLYTTGDWAMLGLAILALAGLGWASKTAIPMFFEQIRLLLNLGSVRENERVLYQGLIWRVTRLSINTLFVNPNLSGGVRRVPLRDLVDLRSRASAPHEPWFPTSRNDWILLEGDRLGQVVFQSPEVVRVQLLGGVLVHYPATEFKGVAFENLSSGFRIEQRFGIDYQHQSICTQEVPELMCKFVTDGLHRRFDEKHLIDLRVEFLEAAASSLDYAIIASFAGDAAPQRSQINRALQRLLVEACNQEGWVIPFKQITLHQAPTA